MYRFKKSALLGVDFMQYWFSILFFLAWFVAAAVLIFRPAHKPEVDIIPVVDLQGRPVYLQLSLEELAQQNYFPWDMTSLQKEEALHSWVGRRWHGQGTVKDIYSNTEGGFTLLLQTESLRRHAAEINFSPGLKETAMSLHLDQPVEVDCLITGFNTQRMPVLRDCSKISWKHLPD